MAGRSAYVFIPFTCTHDVEVRLGFGADFWFEAYLDGESICDNMESGNWNYPPTATDYMEQVILTKGRHLLAIRFISGGGTSLLWAAVYHGQGPLAHATHRFKVDFSQPAGLINAALHGVNHGPLCFVGMFDFTAAHKEMGFSRVRPSATAVTLPEIVDVHTIFPLFHAEVDDPRNYRFLITDEYLESITDAGEDIYYRLGESSAPESWGRYWIHPPADPVKWARICVNIIRHFNERWAKGAHLGITYWEIWNGASDKSNWSGTQEEYFELYAATAHAIKDYNPQLKVGGGGAIGADAQSREFIAFCARKKVPLDFFSWSSQVSHPEALILQAKENRRLLDAAGLTHVENHLNQWSYEPPAAVDSRKWDDLSEARFARCTGAEGAAFQASSLVLFHDACLDAAHSFWGRDGAMGPLDSFGAKQKPFYAFKAFGKMLEVSQRVVAEGSLPEAGLAVLAGLSAQDRIARILISNFQHPDKPMKLHVRGLPWSGRSVCHIHVVNATCNLDLIRTDEPEGSSFVMNLKLPPGTVMLLEIKPVE